MAALVIKIFNLVRFGSSDMVVTVLADEAVRLDDRDFSDILEALEDHLLCVPCFLSYPRTKMLGIGPSSGEIVAVSSKMVVGVSGLPS